MDNKLRRSLIGSELRPRVTGVYLEPKSNDAKRNVFPWADYEIIIMASSQDQTASYFRGYLSDSHVAVGYVPLEEVEILYDFVRRFDDISRNVGIFFRGVLPTTAEQSNLLMILSDYLSTLEKRIINSPRRNILNFSKPLQSIAIGGYDPLIVSGIETSIITNAESARQSDGVVKSISSIRNTVVPLSACSIQSQPYSCPVQIQRRLIGKNIRVHVINTTVISLEIESTEIDYRIDDLNKMRLIHLPQNVSDWCVRAVKKESLKFAAVDLFLEESGIWHCFEINPSPGYDFFEKKLISQGGEPLISRVLYRSLIQ